MKINEVKKPKKISEGLGSTLFGEIPTAAARGAVSGKGTRATLTQDIFIKDFVTDAIASLDNGIKGGIIDPKSKITIGPGGSVVSGDVAKKPDQAQPSDGAAPAGATNTPPAGQASASTPASTPTATSSTSTASATSAPGTASSSGGNNYSFKTTQAGAPTQQPLKPTTQKVNFNIPAKPAEPEPYSWSPEGRPIRPNDKLSDYGQVGARPAPAAPSGYSFKTTQQGQAPKPPLKPTTQRVTFNRQPGLKESVTYQKLNSIFESIVEAPEQPNTPKQSISQYMYDWFTQYMGGVNWGAKEASVIPIINRIQSTYSRDKGKLAITTLAQAAFALAKGGVPKGAANAMQQGSGTDNPQSVKQAFAEINKILDDLEKNDQETYNALIPELSKSIRERQNKMRAAAAPAPNTQSPQAPAT